MTEPVFGLQRRTALILAAIILGFALCATAYTLTYGRSFRKPGGDGRGYERMAKQLLTAGVYGYKSTAPNAYVTPGYPLFLAAVYGASGHAVDGRPRLLLVGLQILAACATLLAVFLIGRRLVDDWVGLVAAALIALYPPTMIATNLWLTETLATCALAWFVYAAIVASGQTGWKLWAVAGVILGVAVLIRPAVLPLGAAPFIALLVTGPRAGVLRAVGVFGVTWALVMTPWVVRNIVTLHVPAVLSSHSGDPMLAGVDPYYYELGPEFDFHGPTYDRYYSEQPGVSKDAFAKAAIAEGFRSDPLRSLWWFTVGKAQHVYAAGWLGTTGFDGSRSTVIRALIAVLGWVGVVYSLWDRRLLAVALMIAIGTVTLLPFVPEPRFAFGFLPLLAVLAAAMLRRIWSRSQTPAVVEA